MTCVFCELMQKKQNVLHEDDKIAVLVSPEPSVAGHCVVVPKQHAPLLEALPDFIVGDVFKAANKIASSIIETVGAQGVNIIVQNGTAAGQRHNHAMLHVIPRNESDSLPLGWVPKPADESELSKMEGTLKDALKNVGIFEKEKPKPVEVELPKEIPKKEDDYRMKAIRRIP